VPWAMIIGSALSILSLIPVGFLALFLAVMTADGPMDVQVPNAATWFFLARPLTCGVGPVVAWTLFALRRRTAAVWAIYLCSSLPYLYFKLGPVVLTAWLMKAESHG
jgi:hypothetical protein